jgi:hypothetical protein
MFQTSRIFAAPTASWLVYGLRDTTKNLPRGAGSGVAGQQLTQTLRTVAGETIAGGTPARAS